jgi:NAD(P)-dependent dehydrogenase (short-subunit alcohol dehydrogenase family)
MIDFRNGTAVITGAASGIGLALAQRAVKEGMKLVLADIEGEKLRAAAAAMGLPDDRVFLQTVDVSREEDIARMADETFDRFGEVHLLCNNAGVCMTRVTWEYSAADWEWVLGVNLRSVIHGVRHFLPRMLKQESDSHVVNTASVAGLLSTPGFAAYNVSKHGVVTLSETLYSELAAMNARVGVSLLCPAWVPTGIAQSGRNRQERFGAPAPISGTSADYDARMAKAVRSGRLTADDMANAVFEAVAANRFYVIPHAKIRQAIKLRMEDILESRNPTPAS